MCVCPNEEPKNPRVDDIYEERTWGLASGGWVRTGRLVKDKWNYHAGGYEKVFIGNGEIEYDGYGGYHIKKEKK
ncbi:MAG: hypothetical protein Q8P07_00685 [bacterium]|nr:hypothetical protein [bacterium]